MRPLKEWKRPEQIAPALSLGNNKRRYISAHKLKVKRIV